MTAKTTYTRVPMRQLPLSLSLPATAVPPLEGMMRAAVVGLLAQLLTSVCTRDIDPEGRDETR